MARDGLSSSTISSPRAASVPSRPGYWVMFRLPCCRVFQIRTSDSLTFRYSFQQPEIAVPPVFGIVGGPGNGAFAGTGTSRSQAPGLSYTRIVNPTLITETRFGISRVHNDVNQTDFGKTTARDIGIGGANIDDWSSGMSSISISGLRHHSARAYFQCWRPHCNGRCSRRCVSLGFMQMAIMERASLPANRAMLPRYGCRAGNIPDSW